MAKSDLSTSVFDAAIVPSIIAGIGCRQGASAAEIIAMVEQALRAAGRLECALIAIATLDRKADEPGLLAAAAHFGVPLRTFSATELAGVTLGSPIVRALVGTSSVAEAAARRAGPIILPKLKSADVTCALASVRADFDLSSFGQAVPGSAPVSTAIMAASRLLTSNAGP